MTPGQYIANEIVAVINAAAVGSPSAWTPGVDLPMSPNTAKVVKLPRFALKELDELQTCVASRSRGLTAAGRGPRKHDIAVQLMLLKKLDKEHSELDDLLEMMYGLDMLIAKETRLGWISSSNDPEYDTDTLETQCAFKSVLTINFSATT